MIVILQHAIEVIRKKLVLDKFLAESSFKHIIKNLLDYDMDESISLFTTDWVEKSC